MSYRIEWSRRAWADLEALRDYIAQDAPRTARLVAGKLQSMADSLVEMPHRGRSVAGASQARELVLGRYLLRYRVVGEVVLIVRVKHSATKA